MGSGGAGGYFGARLAADGNEVIFIDRGEHRDAIASRGLRLLSPGGSLHIESPELFHDPASAGFCDFVLFCVRASDTEAATRIIESLLAHDTAILCLQSGVDGMARLRELFGDRFVMGGFAGLTAEIAEPGVIREHSGAARLVFGELDGGDSWRQECFQSACIGAGIDGSVSTDIHRDIWRNFVLETALTATTVAHRCSIGEVLHEHRGQFETLIEEGIEVAAACGIDLKTDGGESIAALAQSMQPGAKTAALIDLERDRPTELEALLGATIRLGARLSVPTPESRRLYGALQPQPKKSPG